MPYEMKITNLNSPFSFFLYEHIKNDKNMGYFSNNIFYAIKLKMNRE
jgi:hypothetical protein